MLKVKQSVLRTGAFLAAFLAFLSITAETPAHGEYVYSDDFSTDKAKWDSYSHSPFVDSLPGIYLYGLLMYTYVSGGNRALGFYSGFEADADARLCYRFPLSGEQGIITFGTIGIQVVCDSSYANQHLWLHVSYDGQTWSRHNIGDSGLHVFALFPPIDCSQVSLKFVGGAIYGSEGPRLDNLSLSLTIEQGTGIDELTSHTDNTAVFFLSQNYPNPFNSETMISYHLARNSKVKLEVYNITGKLVKLLVDEELPDGPYSVCWNGTDIKGLPVASGLYFYRLQADDFVQTRKMVFIH